MHPVCDACLLLNTFVNSYGPIMVFKDGLKLCAYGHLKCVLLVLLVQSQFWLLMISSRFFFWSFELSQLCFLGLLNSFKLSYFGNFNGFKLSLWFWVALFGCFWPFKGHLLSISHDDLELNCVLLLTFMVTISCFFRLIIKILQPCFIVHSYLLPNCLLNSCFALEIHTLVHLKICL
jgi:hypothetical protein